jgi:drug/metabolite transporter (DMT)-like permease
LLDREMQVYPGDAYLLKAAWVYTGGLARTFMSRRIENTGMLLALCGFALLAIGDAVVKSISGAWPATAIAALRYVIGASALAALLWRQYGRGGFVLPNPKIQLLRGFSIAVGTICFFSALAVMPLAEATAITFTSPMITALLAALVLKEPAGRATVIASIVAFCGVLLILRPNFAELGWAALLPLGSAVCMAVMMIGNRAVAAKGSPLLMQFLIAAVAAPIILAAALAGHLSALPALHISWPDWTIIVRCAVVALTASTAHWLIFLGTTKASAADIAPMTYVQLLIATALGIAIFGDWPDLTSLAGSAIIIGAGLYLWHQRPA